MPRFENTTRDEGGDRMNMLRIRYGSPEEAAEALAAGEISESDVILRFPEETDHEAVFGLAGDMDLQNRYPTPQSIVDDYRAGVVSERALSEVFPESIDQSLIIELAAERNAEESLDALLEDPRYTFLLLDLNQDKINEAESAVESLRIAESLIEARELRTFEFSSLRQVEGVELVEADLRGVKKVIEAIKSNQDEIGRGGDAFVVVYKGELENLPAEVCYKFAIEETTKRGRNSVAHEAEIHTSFYDLAKELEGSKVGVPMPYYATAVGNEELIAMEKLPAKSVDDILRGMGSLPEWFDIDEFCEEITAMLDHFHKNNLYHRDMHVGNVMIRQTLEQPEDDKWGYIIDFGLSGYGHEGMDPYKREVAGDRFTYNDDYGIVKTIRQKLTQYRERQQPVNQRRV